MSEVVEHIGQTQLHDDDITLRDIFHSIHRFVRQMLRFWWLYAVLFLILGGYLVYGAFTTRPVYEATVTFMVNEDEGNAVSSMSSILGQFGFIGRRGRFNLDKIMELSESDRIVQKTLLTKAAIGGDEDYLANYFIEEYELAEEWAEKDEMFEGFRFTKDSVVLFDVYEAKALKKATKLLAGGDKSPGLMSNSYSLESTIMKLTVESTNQDLSIATVNTLFESLSEFYIIQAIEKQRSTFNIVKAKVDSLSSVLADREYALASFQDANRNITQNVANLRRDRLVREIQKLNIMHAEALKNLEIADFSLKTATPFIQEVDKPMAPLQAKIASKKKAAVLGLFVAFVLGSMILIGRNIWVEYVKE